MRILYLADAVFQDMPGGSKMVAWQLARRMASHGHEITFLVPGHGPSTPGEEESEGVHIVRYPLHRRPLPFVRTGQRACARLYRRWPCDIVHTHFAYAGLGPLPALPRFVPRVRTFYGLWDEESWVQKAGGITTAASRAKALLGRRARAWVEDHDLARSDAIIALSDYSAQALPMRGVPPGRIRIIPPGVDTERFVPPTDKRAVRRMLGLSLDRRILLSVRRLVPRMGLDNLIRAMPEVAAHYPDSLLLIGGEGPERAPLQALISMLRLDEHIRLVGFIPHERLAAFYQAADLFVLPTVALEGFGLVTLEAMASGVPVIGTPVGAIPEVLTRVDPRLVSEGVAPGALARAVCRFWEEGLGDGLSPATLHDFAHRHYSWEGCALATSELYTELCGRTAKPARAVRQSGSLS